MADHKHGHEHGHEHGHPHQGHDHGHEHGGADAEALAEVLDLDAEVLSAHLGAVTAWVAGAVPPPGLVVDLGAGTGVGTFALLREFPGARVVALDLSAPLLERLRARADGLGVADRVEVRQTDLDAAWPDLTGRGGAGVDLVWASASLHHLADPDRVLADVVGALRPGGALVVLELEGFPRFLPDDVGLGTPGLEARVHAELAARRADDLPAMASDWGARLAAAGFSVQAREFAVELTADLPAATGRYARACLGRVRTALADRLTADDLAVLDVLLADSGPASLLERDDLTVRTRRSGWIATRP